jgi:hypothetical protein
LGRTVTAEIGYDGAASLGGQERSDIHIRVNVVWKAVQEHRHRPVRRPFLVIGDVEHAGIDVTKRLQPTRGRCTHEGGGLSSLGKRRAGPDELHRCNS